MPLNRPKVWVIHEQMKKDASTGQLRRAFDTRAAERFGQRVALFSDAASHMEFGDALTYCREKLADFQPQDYLLFCGAPDLAAAAIVTAADVLAGEPLKMLIWCKTRQKPDYEVRMITRRRNNG